MGVLSVSQVPASVCSTCSEGMVLAVSGTAGGVIIWSGISRSKSSSGDVTSGIGA